MSSACARIESTESVSNCLPSASTVNGISLSSYGDWKEVERSTKDVQRVRTDGGIKATPRFKEFLALLISEVPQVRSVFIRQENRLISIYVVTEQFDFDVNERIYDREENIMNAFFGFDFDFHITCQREISDTDLELVLSR